MSNKNYSVCVVGLGVVGLPTAAYLHNAGCEVFGYDINPKVIDKAREQIPAGDLSKVPKDTEVFIVCVSTSRQEERPDVTNVYDACATIADRFNPKIISIESTIPVGTCRDIHQSILNEQVNLAHVPHRYWPEDPLNHGVPQLRVAGGVNDDSLIKARDFYSDLGVPLFQVEPIEIAEMSKIVENAYRYIQIAFAEELKLICDRNNINFNNLRYACNTKWNIQLPETRTGIGGTCLPKDIRYLIDAARRRNYEPDILVSALQANKKYVEHLMRPVCYA